MKNRAQLAAQEGETSAPEKEKRSGEKPEKNKHAIRQIKRSARREKKKTKICTRRNKRLVDDMPPLKKDTHRERKGKKVGSSEIMGKRKNVHLAKKRTSGCRRGERERNNHERRTHKNSVASKENFGKRKRSLGGATKKKKTRSERRRIP